MAKHLYRPEPKFVFWLVFTLFVVAILSFQKELVAQSYDFKSYTVSDGLPHGQINDLVQDRKGFMWIGTTAMGLVRFDGHEFITYGIANGLKDDMVITLFEDSRENLWVATYSGGVARMEGDSLIYPFEDSLLNESYVTSINESPDGEIWFGTFENGLFIYNGESFQVIDTESGLPHNAVWGVHWNRDESIWLATHGGLSILRGGQLTNLTTEDGLSGNRVFKFAEASNGELWMATSKGVTIYDGQAYRTITEINGRSLNFIFDIAKGADGRIWLGTENDGVFWYDNGEFTHVTKSEGLVSNYIHRFHLDRNNTMWIATDESGISLHRGETFRFFNEDNVLISNQVYDVFRDQTDRIWIGTDKGVQVFDGTRFSTLKIPNIPAESEPVWLIRQYSNGNLLFVLEDNTIIEYDGRRFSNVSEKNNFPELYIFDILIDSNDLLWIGADNGLYSFDGKSLKSFTRDDGIPGSVIYNIFESSDGTIWVATNLGVGKRTDAGFEAIRYRDGLGHYNVNHITEDHLGHLWFGTSAGVTLYIPGNDDTLAKMVNFGASHGMRLVQTQFLWFDDNDQLWQGTNGGIHRMDVATYRQTGHMAIEHYKLSKSGIGVETMHKAALTAANGHIWFGTMEGIIVLDTESLERIERNPPQTYLSSVAFNGVHVAGPFFERAGLTIDGAMSRSFMKFPYGNNTYSFQFTGIEFLFPDNVSYQYRLEGFDTDWKSLSNGNTATYTNLGAGNYTFLVQSRVGAGPWSSAVSGFSFSVAKPYWQTVWFWSIMFLGIGTILYSFIQYRINSLERSKLAVMVEEKTSHLRDALIEKEVLLKEIHHRVKNNLAVIYGLLELQSDQIHEESLKSVFRDSQLRVQSIALVHEKLYQHKNLSKIEAKSYVPELVEVIVKSMKLGNKNIRRTMDIDEFDMTIDQGIPCGLILNELISNAYKHAHKNRDSGEIVIALKQTDEDIVLRVSDDGVGMPSGFVTENSASLGLLLVETLASQLGTELKITSNGHGTSFEVSFKINQIHEES